MVENSSGDDLPRSHFVRRPKAACGRVLVMITSGAGDDNFGGIPRQDLTSIFTGRAEACLETSAASMANAPSGPSSSGPV
jgi:hypothetical protein